MTNSPIIIALDTPNTDAALKLTETLKPEVGLVKLGLEFFVANGAIGVQHVQSADVPIFLDLKFHDIPNTVAGAVRSACELGVDMLTIHLSGGYEMLQAAVDVTKEYDKPPKILGVSVLTSMDEITLKQTGIRASTAEQVLRLGELGLKAGLDGMVCSPLELPLLTERFADKFQYVTPGIRPENSDKGDQKRTLTPKEALDVGANYLVIGRPITQADNPLEEAENINRSLY